MVYEKALRAVIAYKMPPDEIISFWDAKGELRPLVGTKKDVAEWILDTMEAEDLEELVRVIMKEEKHAE